MSRYPQLHQLHVQESRETRQPLNPSLMKEGFTKVGLQKRAESTGIKPEPVTKQLGVKSSEIFTFSLLNCLLDFGFSKFSPTCDSFQNL
jgi:hypothetical protein